MIETPVVPRSIGQKNVLKLACTPIPIVRVALVGLGLRGFRALNRFVHLQGAQVKVLCDILPQNIVRSQQVLEDYRLNKADEYIGCDSWKQVCERDDIDLLYICTDWLSHTPMAVYAMEQGKHVAIEVPAATSVAECWQLVNTAEKTQRHCMMLENCCYDSFELATLNMAQQGVFGEILHAEGAYIHDLRERNLSQNSSINFHTNWQNQFNLHHTGNPYPTHGLGAICQILNIHRGDKLNHLVSMSTKQAGITAYLKEKFGEESAQAKQEYKLGDMNTTLIKTHRGKTIMLQHDVSSPRPYSRIHLISGTKGFAQKYPIEQIALAPNGHTALDKKEMELILDKYKHPFVARIGELAQQICEDRARDFMMDYRLIYCLQNGLPLDQDVYDAAEWSCIVELSEQSVMNNSMPVQIPDFTRGEWDKLKGLEFA